MLVVVETWADCVVWFGYGEHQLENRSAKKVREAQARANEARLERERQNVVDAASLLVELGRLAEVDEWELAASWRCARRGSGAVTNTARRVRRRCRGCWIAVKR